MVRSPKPSRLGFSSIHWCSQRSSLPMVRSVVYVLSTMSKFNAAQSIGGAPSWYLYCMRPHGVPGEKLPDTGKFSREDRGEAEDDHHGSGLRRDGRARTLRHPPRSADRAPVRLHDRDRLAPPRRSRRCLAERARPGSLRLPAGRQLRGLGRPAGSLRGRTPSRAGRQERLGGRSWPALLSRDGDGANGLRDRPDKVGRAAHAPRGLIHDAAFVLFVLALLAALFALWLRFRFDRRWRGHARYTLATGMLAPPLLLLPGVAYYLFVVTVLAWIGVTALRLWRPSTATVNEVLQIPVKSTPPFPLAQYPLGDVLTERFVLMTDHPPGLSILDVLVIAVLAAVERALQLVPAAGSPEQFVTLFEFIEPFPNTLGSRYPF